MKNFFLLFLSLLCVACASLRQVTPKDEIRTELRIETIIQTDTVIVERPQIIERVATLDTMSVLDNRYAHSEASFSGGILQHSLEAKPVKEPVPVQTKTIVKDSLVFRDRVVTETVTVEKPLNWWTKTMIRLGYLLLIILSIAIARTIYKLIINH